MPSYDFRCTSCDHRFEIVRPVSRAADAECCPECKADAKRVFSPVGVVFKGSGFHNTDYRAKPAETAPAKDSSPAAGGSACGSAPSCSGCPAAE